MNKSVKKYIYTFSILILFTIVMIFCTYFKYRSPHYVWYNTEKKSSEEILKEVIEVNPMQKLYPTKLPEDIEIYKIEARNVRSGMGTLPYVYIYSDYSIEKWQEYYENYTVKPIYGVPKNGEKNLCYDKLRKAMLVYSPTVTSFVETLGEKRK